MQHIKEAGTCAEQLLSELRSAGSICLTTHVNPDGDGLCTCLAMKRILLHLGYKADIITDDLNLDRYGFLDIYSNVRKDNPDLQYDLVVIIDLHDYQRLGSRIHLVQGKTKVFVLDHHEIDNDMMSCDCCWIDSSAVCTGWMLYKMFNHKIEEMPETDKLYVSNCLYTTLLNDTNNFMNANTDRHAFELAIAMIDYGVIPSGIYRQYMLSRTPSEMRLLGQVLSTIEFHGQGKLLFMNSTLAMLQENNLDKEATSNLTRWVQDLKGVDSIVYFREEKPGEYRLSLRSKKVNVHDVAVRYGGGGHLQASGCHFHGTLEEAKEIMLREISQASLISNKANV